MKKLFAVVGIALATACADSPDPTGFEVQHTIDVPGNVLGTAGCAAIDYASCFAILDNQVKILYERTAWAARRGEADYRVITGTNKNLSYIFQAETRRASVALSSLDNFIRDINAALGNETVSACWGNHLLTFAQWLRGKVAAGNVDVSDAPQMDCFVSPVTDVLVESSTTNGVVLTLADPWQFNGDPYGVYQTRTNFVVNGPNGSVVTPLELQAGAATVVIADDITKTAGSYDYSVTQCADWGQCSAPFAFKVTVAEGSTGGVTCVHDNRDKQQAGRSLLPKCKKD